MGTLIKVATRNEIPEGSGKTVEAGGKKLALFHLEGKFYAIDNTCKHRGGPLSEGELVGRRVICPWHGWGYDVTTGRNVDDDAIQLGCYAVRVEGEDLFVET